MAGNISPAVTADVRQEKKVSMNDYMDRLKALRPHLLYSFAAKHDFEQGLRVNGMGSVRPATGPSPDPSISRGIAELVRIFDS